MKILHINSYFSKAQFYNNLFKAQRANGLTPFIYIPVASNENTASIPCSQDADVNVVKAYGKYDRYMFHLKQKKILNDILKRYDFKKIDLMHAHSLFSNGYTAYKLNKKYKIPYIVAVRGTDINVFFRYMFHLRRVGISILDKASKVIFLSPEYKRNSLKPYLPKGKLKEITEKALVIPNGIDNFWLNNRYNPKNLETDKKIKILFVGRVSKLKNITTTINACIILIKQGFNVDFTIVGKVEDQSELKKLQGYDFVKYIGPCEKERLIEYYQNNDIFVMPSRIETFGLVYAEAMSQGLPIVYTKGQGFDGQFEEGVVGFHVDCNNADDVANGIIKIIKNYEKLSRNCLNLCGKFSWDKISNEYERVYESIQR